MIFVILPRKNHAEKSSESVMYMMERLSVVSAVKSKMTLCFVQFAGGSFGSDETVLGIEQSGAMAWASSLHLEQKELKVRIVDFHVHTPELSLVDALIKEVSTEEKFSASGYNKAGERQVLYPQLHDSSYDAPSPLSWSKEDTLVVTGGAKGITAECALAFAKTTGVKMALLGSSKIPEKSEVCEINTTLKRFHALGLEADYYRCNLADEEAVSKTLHEINAEMGEVTGVIHGAGLNTPKPLSAVRLEDAKVEIAPKVMGAINLMTHFEEKPLKMFASLTSIIGVSGMIGNGWYGFANEVLDLLAAQYGQRHSETKIVSLAYSVWGETGMGAKMGSTAYLEKMGIMAIPTQEGVDRFMGLTLRDTPFRQVVVTAKLEGLDTWQTPVLEKPYSNRYLEKVVYAYPKVNVITEVKLHPDTDPYLRDHVWKDSLLFPTVFGLEAMSQVVAYMMRIDKFIHLKIENINLERPIVVDPQVGMVIQIKALALEQVKGEHKRIQVSISTEKSQFKTVHFSAIFVLDGADNFRHDVEGLPNYDKKRLPIDVQKDVYSWLLFQGPKFQRLTDFYQIDNDTAIYDSQTKVGEEKEWMLGSPYVRDSLLQSVQPMVPHHNCLPIFIDSLHIVDASKALPEKIRGVSLHKGLKDEIYNASVYAMEDASNIYEKLEGYRLKILDHRTEFPTELFFAESVLAEESAVVSAIEACAKGYQNEKPTVAVYYMPTLEQMTQSERHQAIAPLASSWFKKLNQTFSLSWDSENIPVITSKEYTFSMSHSQSYLFFQLSKKEAGCDIEQVVHRSVEKWEKLLHLSNDNFRDLYNRFIDHGDSIDVAGTRLWSIRESIYKARGTFEGNLYLESMEEGCALVLGEDEGEGIEILSLSLSTERGSDNMIAFIGEEK